MSVSLISDWWDCGGTLSNENNTVYVSYNISMHALLVRRRPGTRDLLHSAELAELPRAWKPNHAKSNMRTQTHVRTYARTRTRTVRAAIQATRLLFQDVPKATNCWLSHKWVSLPHEKYHSSNSEAEAVTSWLGCIYVQHWLRTACALYDSPQQPTAICLFIHILCVLIVASPNEPISWLPHGQTRLGSSVDSYMTCYQYDPLCLVRVYRCVIIGMNLTDGGYFYEQPKQVIRVQVQKEMWTASQWIMKE